MAFGSISAVLSYTLHRIIKNDAEKMIVPNMVYLKEAKTNFRKYLTFYLTSPIVLFILLCVVFAPNNSTLKSVAFLLSTTFVPIWLFNLMRRWIHFRPEKSISHIINWAQTLSYYPETEAYFPFPTKIFNFNTDDGVDFAVTKIIAGIKIRLFQYTHTQKSGKDDHILRYLVISIDTQGELPSFNFVKLPSSEETRTDLLAGAVEYNLKEEIPDSTKIQFRIQDEGTFQLAVEKKFEIEALQIFTPDTAESLGKNWPAFLINATGKNVSAITMEPIKSAADLERYDKLAQFLVNHIAVYSSSIGKSVEALREMML